MTPDLPILFTPWAPWPHRDLVKNAHLPGVYLLAQRDTAPPPRVDPLSQDIIYIGETTEGSLTGRWQQFHRAAFQGKPGHTAGLIYHDTFPSDETALYVAAFTPEGLTRDLRTLYIRHVTHKLLWEWARRWGSAPICNSK